MNKYKIKYYEDDVVSKKVIEADRFEISGGGALFYIGTYPAYSFSSYVSVETVEKD